jgi:hypothetical protein
MNGTSRFGIKRENKKRVKDEKEETRKDDKEGPRWERR